MLESAETGIYPQYLTFDSSKYDRSWTHKFRGNSKKGELRMKGEVIYTYHYKDGICIVRDMEGNIVGEGPSLFINAD